MAFPSNCAPGLWTLSLLTLLASSVQSNISDDEDPFQPVTQDETVSAGGTVTLTCRVAESDNSSLQWSNTAQQTLYFGEKRALRDNRIQLNRSTGTELSITIGNVQLSDEGQYTCSIFTMPVRTASATVIVLGVPSSPNITGYKDNVQEGDKITLKCNSSGSKPPAKLRWFRGQEELTGGPNAVEPTPGGLTYTVISELTLTLGRSDDNTVIACVVDHPSLAPGDKRSKQLIRVQFTPDVNIQPESDLPREGDKFHLQCVGDGNPQPILYNWQKKEGELSPLAKVDGSFLRFEMLNKSDNGVYLCEVDNGVGKVQGQYTLLVQGQADDSITLSPASYPESSAPTSDSTPSSPSPSCTSLAATASGSFPSMSPFSYSSDVTISSSVSSPPPSSPPALSPSLSSSPPLPSLSIPSSSLSNSLFPHQPFPSSSFSPLPSPASVTRSVAPSSAPLPPSSVPKLLNGGYSLAEDGPDNIADPTAMSTSSGVDHAVIGGVVAVIVFILLCLLIVLGRYLIRHKGTYLTHEAKGSDDAPDADTAIINAEGGHSGADDKKEYFI